MTFKVFPKAILSHFLIISYLVQCVKCVSPGNGVVARGVANRQFPGAACLNPLQIPRIKLLAMRCC